MGFLRKKLSECYRKLYYERPSENFRKNILETLPDHGNEERSAFKSRAEHLCDEGFLLLPDYFKGDELSALQEDFERIVSDKDWDHMERKQILREELQKSMAASKAAADPYLTSLVEYYWGKKIYLAEFSGFRYGPTHFPDISNNMWHHDTKRKQIKIFIGS